MLRVLLPFLLALGLLLSPPAHADAKSDQASRLAWKSSDMVAKGDLTKAIKLIEKAKKLDPANPQVLLRSGALNLAWATALKIESGSESKATAIRAQGLTDLRLVSELSPDSPWADTASSMVADAEGGGSVGGLGALGDMFSGELGELFGGGDGPLIDMATIPSDAELKALPADAVASMIDDFPGGGSNNWDEAVRKVLLGAYDSDLTGKIDSLEELESVPCSVFRALDSGVQRNEDVPIMAMYGFTEQYIWVGYTLGFVEDLRPELAERGFGCGLLD